METDIDIELSSLREELRELKATVQRLSPRNKAWIPPHANVGENVDLAGTVSLICRADTPIVIGNYTKIYRNAEILGPVVIGQRCMLNRDAYIRAHTSIGDNVFIGPFVRLITDGHVIGSKSKRAGKNQTLPIVVGNGVWIGASSTVLGGVTIGDGAMVAAGSLVNKNVPSNALVAGVPARVIRMLEE